MREIARDHPRIGEHLIGALCLLPISTGVVTTTNQPVLTVALAFLAMVFARLSVFAALGPACAIAVLFVVPWLDTSKVRSAVYRPWYKLFFWIFAANAIFLGWLGSPASRTWPALPASTMKRSRSA